MSNHKAMVLVVVLAGCSGGREPTSAREARGADLGLPLQSFPQDRCWRIEHQTQIRFHAGDCKVDNAINGSVIRHIAAAVILNGQRSQVVTVHQTVDAVLYTLFNSLETLGAGCVV